VGHDGGCNDKDTLEVLNTELQDHKVYFVAESDAASVIWISNVNTPMLAIYDEGV
jgi:hypothetical protein